MGALEFEPNIESGTAKDKQLEMHELIDLASMAFTNQHTLDTSLLSGKEEKAIFEILSVCTSASGARAKAVIAYNPNTWEIRSGAIEPSSRL